MKRILSTSFIFLMLAMNGSYSAKAEGHTGSRSITLNPVEAQAGGDTNDMALPDDGEVMHVARKPILTQTDFKSAKVDTKNGRIVLQATLNEPGARKLKTYSSRHVGQKLAVLLGGQLVQVPRIRVPIVGQGVEIDDLSNNEAQNLAQLINHGS